MIKRIFLIVLDSFGIGELPDADLFNDKGSNTLNSISKSKFLIINTLKRLGLFNIDGVNNRAIGGVFDGVKNPEACYARVSELSKGKDTTIGHWEIAGIVSSEPLPTYPNGFPQEVISEFERQTGRKTLCNKPYSGTEVIKDFGEQHLKTGALIVYTSADSVFQIAAHQSVVSLDELYKYCEIARKILVGKHGVGRVIARPFDGEYPFVRTAGRHDYSLLPPKTTMLDELSSSGKDVISIGKINDIFAGRGITKSYKTSNNLEGMKALDNLIAQDFNGLCFANLVDFDMLYGHRNDVDGYAKAISEFDCWLEVFLSKLKDTDAIIITADHGCDPLTISTDHSREYVPLLVYGKSLKVGVNLKTLNTFSDIASTILDAFSICSKNISGKSFLDKIKNN